MDNKKKKIFIITGEFSGDKHAAAVTREIRKIMPDCIIEGVGESNLEAQGVKLFRNHEKMGKVGLTPSMIFNHIFLGIDIINYLKNEYKPDLVLLVDYGAFNLQISKRLKKEGIKCFYFIPPQIWASRKWRIKALKKNVDKVLTIFPFEKDFYEREGLKSEFVGHPIKFELPECNKREEFFKKHNLDPNKKLIGVFCGSRIFEIKFLLKTFLAAVKLIEKARSDVQFVFSKAKSLPENAFSVPYLTLKDENHALLAYSDALILASGTVALEAAIYQTPMLIAYRAPLFFYLVYLLVRSIKKACLVNIITGGDYVEEYIMFRATPKNIANEINEILDNPKKKEHILQGCRLTSQMLGDKHCAENVARIIKEELTGA